MQKRKKDTRVSLSLDAYRAEQEQTKAASDKYKESQKLLPDLAIDLLKAPAPTADTTLINRANRFVKPLRKDLALREAVAVIQDAL
jgi:carboxyl-terminal processing protease